MANPLGTKALSVRQAPNNEWGVWRVNEENCLYLLLTVSDVDQAVVLAKQLAKVFNLIVKIDKSQYH
jgi:hypothetical protein